MTDPPSLALALLAIRRRQVIAPMTCPGVEIIGEAAMIPFFVLVAAFLIFRAVGLMGVSLLDSWPSALRPALTVMFLLTASAHFGKGRADLIRMVPPAFPRPAMLVTLTGFLEIAGAIGLLIPATAPAAALGLALMMVALFPANIYAARHHLTVRGREATPLPLRAVLQVVFIAAVVAAGWSARTS